MVSGSERSSRDGSRLRRHRTLSVPLPPTSQSIPPPPTSQVLPPAPTSQELPLPPTFQWIAPSSSPQGSSMASASFVSGPSAPSAPSWGRGTSRRGPTRGVIQKDFAKLPVATKELIFRDLQHVNGKYLDDAIASVPADVDSFDWQIMCEMWTNGDEWETMTQLMARSSDIDAKSHTPATPEEAFISVMGKDRPGRVRYASSGETLSTWSKSTATACNSERERIMQEQLKAQEKKLKAQAEEMTQMRENITRLENVATKVDEMSALLS
ncbi:hypothetical protein Taro_032571 [Colocasia esculenta]|uniref:Uncharacterized protein n=1 Tax=Colocasia esculenta TaxID=4460 RepID=A0A843VZG7_COLES|nr:hypothetical protein [Colocasia esculenta]